MSLNVIEALYIDFYTAYPKIEIDVSKIVFNILFELKTCKNVSKIYIFNENVYIVYNRS